jgi:hypothetical protein
MGARTSRSVRDWLVRALPDLSHGTLFSAIGWPRA